MQRTDSPSLKASENYGRFILRRFGVSQGFGRQGCAERSALGMAMNKQVEEIAARYIGQLGGPEHDDAYHGLLECDHAVVPILASAFERESDPEKQALLVNVAWQHRSSDALEFLARAVAQPHDQVWKEALDGFVAIGGHQARDLLENERSRLRSLAQVPEERLAWLQEAIDQLAETQA